MKAFEDYKFSEGIQRLAARQRSAQTVKLDTKTTELDNRIEEVSRTANGMATVASTGNYNDLINKPQLPSSQPAQTHKFFTAYNPETGGFTAEQPAFGDISGMPALAFGSYTPTLTNWENLDASTAYQCQYMRVGSMVTVSGRADVDPTAAATITKLGISLPIPSNFSEREQCGGTAFSGSVSGQGAAIRADYEHDRAEMIWFSQNIDNHDMYFTFTYEVR